MAEEFGSSDQRMSPEVQAALEQCRRMITVGSKSFSLAAKLFGTEAKEAAFFLYGWCRYCDDQVDQAKDKQQAEAQLAELKRLTRSAYLGEPQTHPVFIAFQYVTKKYSIPEHYPLELLEGMAMDVSGYSYETLQDLELYCYRVAGVVGLMMVHIMGISDQNALKNACDMGSAMQMTNISRDILEDASMGRVYLPNEWLKEAGLKREDVPLERSRQKVAEVVKRLLKYADQFYDSGKQGQKYLPVRAAFAVSAARAVYSQIGKNVLTRGPKAWDSRTIVPKWKKWIALGKGVVDILISVPFRMFRRWNAVSINIIWRHG